MCIILGLQELSWDTPSRVGGGGPDVAGAADAEPRRGAAAGLPVRAGGGVPEAGAGGDGA